MFIDILAFGIYSAFDDNLAVYE